MATKRDRKTAFPFIKPKGSIKKDVQQYRKAVMSQNGDDAEVRDAMINPVQRRESSASRFLKHFRPDRNNPAYHSEGKGLRKRRNWTSERQLSHDPAGSDSNQQQQRLNANQPQRSHSFSEPDGPFVRPSAAAAAAAAPPAPATQSSSKDKETTAGVRESFRWRFNKSSSKSLDQSSKGGDTSKKAANRTKSGGLPSSGAVDTCPPSPPASWTRSSNNGSINNSPTKKSSSNNHHLETNLHQDSSVSVVDGRPSNVQQHQQQQQPKADQGGHPTSGQCDPTYNGRAVPASESDYVNYEVFASQLGWPQKQLEPDLIRNLPYQEQQSLAGNSPKHVTYINNQPSPHRHSNRVTSCGSLEGLRKDPYHPATAHPPPQHRAGRDATPDRPRSLYHTPATSTSSHLSVSSPSYVNMQHPPAASGYVPYSRPPAPLPDSALMAEPQQPPSYQHHHHHQPMNSPPGVMSWQWSDSSPTNHQPDDEETHYASQLRSSMAALLQGHIRQSSTASNASSNFSSYSDEFRSPVDSAGSLGIPANLGGANRYVSNVCGSASESGYETYADAGGCYAAYNSPAMASSPPPPPPPVRDASSLKYVKYGPGHEKHPSWPMAANNGMPPPVNVAGPMSQCSSNAAGSQRSKSWTESTDYPKEPAASYARPVPSVRPAYSQQLKTVMENCERIPAEVYQATASTGDLLLDRANYGLPSYDCDGRNIDDKDYTIPSPPERDISGPRLTYAPPASAGSIPDNGGDYAKYEDIQQYSHSEGYSSYVPSESSYVSVSGVSSTPLLDQLRRDSDGNGNDNAVLVKESGGVRDSVSTVVTHSSGSNSSNETLRWHGSYSDISVISSTGGGHQPRHHHPNEAAAAALVVHSAKVQAPQRHNSESVLYYEQQQQQQQQQSGGSQATSGVKTINRMGGWSQRVERKNQWNANQSSSSQKTTTVTEESSVSSSSLSSGVDAPAPLSVAERIHQLEWQSRSVPNLTKGMESPQRSANAPPPARPATLVSHQPESAPAPTSRSSSSSSSSSSSTCSSNGSPEKDGAADGSQRNKFTFLDPDKRMRVADPTLKAIQKQALLSYYERHAGRSSNANQPPKSPPPPALPRTASSSGSPTHPAKNDGQQQPPGGETCNSSELVSSSAALVAVESGGQHRKSLPVETFNPPATTTAGNSGLVPPERPPKKPHLRAAGGISPDQEMRRIEASAQELMNLNPPRSSLVVAAASAVPSASTSVVSNGPAGKIGRKPPAPDPPCSPPQRPASSSPVQVSIRSPSPDLPLPPPPPQPSPLSSTLEEVADDPLPPPPPPHLILDDGRTQSPPTTTYHQESYIVHRKTHSPNGAYHRRSADNLLAESSFNSAAWEKHYNVRQGNVATAALIFSSASMTSPSSSTGEASEVSTSECVKTEPIQSPVKSTVATFISEVTIPASALATESLSVSPQTDSRPTTPQHTYRSLINAKAERFAYLRQVSEGRSYPSTSGTSKLSDPGPPKSLMEFNQQTTRSVSSSAQHQRSHSDSDSHMPSSGSWSIHPPKPPVPTKVSHPPRPKRPEEVECDQLSKDLMTHLLPSDSRLHALLSVPDPAQAAACLRTEGLLEVITPPPVPAAVAPALPVTPPPSQPPTLSSPIPSSATPSPNRSNSCAPLPATSAYFTTSEPRAKLLTRYHSNHILASLDGRDDGQCGKSGEPVDSELLIKKKEELVSRLARKLDVLRTEREAIQEEVEANELLGRSVTSRVACVATPAETNKVFLHVAEVDKITALLLALAGRLARAQNALLSLPNQAEAQEKMVLEGKRDKLLEQLEEAKRLKENIDRRSRQVSGLLCKYLSDEEFADYSHFVTMKAKLVIDQREIDEKIKLGDEQLAALRETLHLRPRV